MEGFVTAETILAFVGMIIIVLGHLCTTVWWMSKITITLEILTKTVTHISSAIERHDATYYNKEDAMREIGRIENKIDKAHERIDELKNK